MQESIEMAGVAREPAEAAASKGFAGVASNPPLSGVRTQTGDTVILDMSDGRQTLIKLREQG